MDSIENLGNTTVVLGDSHARAFSYSDLFIPISIGPGYHSCFYTEDKAKLTESKLRVHLNLINNQYKVLIVLGEPDIRHTLENEKSEDAIENTLKKAANRYAHIINQIGNDYNHSLSVLSTVPTERLEHNKWAKYYNEILRQKLDTAKVKYVDIWPQTLSTEGKVQTKFMADHIHLNPQIVPFVLDALHINKSSDDFEWSFFYKFQLEGNVTGIWGDMKSDKLAPSNRKNVFDKFPKTAQNNVILQYLVLNSQINKNSKILIQNAREGWFFYALKELGYSNVHLLEQNNMKRVMGEHLSSIFLSNSETHYINDAGSERYDLVITDLREEQHDKSKLTIEAKRKICIESRNAKSILEDNTLNQVDFKSVEMIIWDSEPKRIVDSLKRFILINFIALQIRYRKNSQSKKIIYTVD